MSKTFDELTIADDFMFSKVMLNERLAKHFLEVILGCRIHSVTYPKYEHYINVRYDAKSIRLDVILEDDNHTVYNLEMQTAKLTGLVKRSRYYQDLIDLDLLQKGAKYDELNHSIVIFICTFDLFGKNQWIYRFYNVCQQLPELKLQDGTEKVFVNTMGELGDVDEEFKQVMQIFNGLQAEGDFAEELQQEVERVKLSEEWRREYMTLQVLLDDTKREGYKEGHNAGLIEGLNEGLNEGDWRRLIHQICRKLQKGKNIPDIADELEETEDVIAEIVSVIEQCGTDCDEELICKKVLEIQQEK